MIKISRCPICGKEFQHVRKQTYCKNPHYKTCQVCGEEFLVPYHRLYDYNNIVNCGSKECAAKRRSGSMKATAAMMPKGWNAAKTIYHRTCKWCGAPFDTNISAKLYCDKIHYRKCAVCGKEYEMPNDQIGAVGARKTCSAECDRKLREQRTFEKYGVTAYAQTQEWKDRIAAQKDEIDAKRRATSLERYGVEHKSTLRKKH